MAYNDLNTKFTGNSIDAAGFIKAQSDDTELKSTVDGVRSIKAGLERFLNTPKGHNPFDRDYGCSLYNLLFKTNVSAHDIQMLLYMDITNYEPRVTLSPADITVNQLDNNTYQVSCVFRIPQYNNIITNVSTTLTKE